MSEAPVEVVVTEPTEASSSEKMEQVAELLMDDPSVQEAETEVDVNGSSDYVPQEAILEAAQGMADDKAQSMGQEPVVEPETDDSAPLVNPALEGPVMTVQEINTGLQQLSTAMDDLQGRLSRNEISEQQYMEAQYVAKGVMNDLHAKDLQRQDAINKQAEVNKGIIADLSQTIPELRTEEGHRKVLEQGINYLRDQGMSDAEIYAIQDPTTIKYIYKQMKSEQSRKQHKLKVKAQNKLRAKQNRQMKTVNAQTHTNTPSSREEQLTAISGLLSGI